MKGKAMKDNVISETDVTTNQTKIAARNVQVFYGDTHAIKDVSVDIQDKTVTAFIGPSGCGKSTFLRCINRMNDTIDICTVKGDILIDGEDIYDSAVDPVQLRAKVGMVFQKPNPFPKSIYDNVAYGPRIHGLARNKSELDDIVERQCRIGLGQPSDLHPEFRLGIDGPAHHRTGGARLFVQFVVDFHQTHRATLLYVSYMKRMYSVSRSCPVGRAPFPSPVSGEPADL